MINVLSLVSYPFLPARVGGEKAIAHFYRHLSSAVSLTCVTTKKNEPRAAQGYEVFNILSNSPLRYANVFYFFALKRIIREKDITHLLIEHPYYGWLAVLLKSFTGVKLVVRSHNIEGLRWKSLNKWWWKILLRYERWTHRRADYNFFIQNEDVKYAIKHFGLQPGKCLEVLYGISKIGPTAPPEKELARNELLSRHNISSNNTLILFNGSFNYAPNLQALKRLVYEINPLLIQRSDFKHYTLLICGKDIPADISSQPFENILFAGFVDDIDSYYTGADIFVNTVNEGGGIKTKLVEALAFNLNVISTENGAIGIDPALCNGKLSIVGNEDYRGFADAIVAQASRKANMPPVFYDRFNWDNIVKRALAFISK